MAVGFLEVGPQPVSAQQAPTPANSSGAATLSVGPAIIDNEVSPGVSFDTEVTLYNVSEKSLAIHATVSGLVPDSKYDPDYAAAYDASKWFTLSTPDFLLMPNQQQIETVKISVPADAEAGGHYATIFFESFSPSQPSDGDGAAINPRVGVLTLLSVRGDIRERAEISGPLNVHGFQGEAGPTAFDLAVRNDGNVHLVPYGTVTIRNVFGRKVKTIPLPLGTLLPGTTRKYDLNWEHGLRFGIYKATANVAAGSQNHGLAPVSSRFILFPLIIAIPVMILLATVIGFAVWRHRRVKRRNVRRQQRAAADAAAAAETSSEEA